MIYIVTFCTLSRGMNEKNGKLSYVGAEGPDS